MTRIRPFLALFFALGLMLAACPEDVEEAIQQDDPDDPMEIIRQAASNTLGEGTAEATITLGTGQETDALQPDTPADDTDTDVTDEYDTATTDDDDATTTDDDDATTTDDDTTATEDDDEPVVTEEDDLTEGDPDLVEDRLVIQSDEDFNQERRRLMFPGVADGTDTTQPGDDATNGTTGTGFGIIVDGTDIYVPLDTMDTTGPEATPAPENDDDATDDDQATEDETADVEWGWFDLSLLEEDRDQAADDTDTQMTTTGDDLQLFPFRDSHAILVVLENAEGEASEGDATAEDGTEDGTDTNGTATGTSYQVTLDVEETADAAGDAGDWLRSIAEGQDRFDVTVWVDDEDRVVQVEYEVGATGADPATDTTTTEDDDATTTDDDDAVTTEDDDTATIEDEDTTATEDDDQRVTDEDDLTTTPTEAQDGLLVTIEYTQFGVDIEVEVPDQDQVTEIDETQLRQHLPALPTAGMTGDVAPTPETTSGS